MIGIKCGFSLVGGRKNTFSAANQDSAWQAQQQMVCCSTQSTWSLEANSCRHDSGVSVGTATGADARRWPGTVAQPRLTSAWYLQQKYAKNTVFLYQKNVTCLDDDSDSCGEAVRQPLNRTEQSACVYLCGRQRKVRISLLLTSAERAQIQDACLRTLVYN